jgi:hypothetical protein
MNTLTTPSAQSLNFELKTNWSITKLSQTKDKLKKGHLEQENHKTQDLERKQQTTNEKAKKNSIAPLTFSMQALSL